MLDELAIITVRGIGLGAIYSLVAMSFNIVKVSSGIINFAQGIMIILGGVVTYFLSSIAGGMSAALWFALLPVAAMCIGLLMIVQGYITLLPMRYSHDQHSWLITTMAVSIIIGAILLLVQGPNALNVSSVFASFDFLGTRVPAPYALVAILAVLWYLFLRFVMSRTLWGLAISALWQNLDAAKAAGLRVHKLQLLAFFVSGLIVGSAGYASAPMLSIIPGASFHYTLMGFVVLVLGGMGSNLGALIAGPILGVIGMFASYHFGGEFQSLVSLFILVGVLIVRPQGLFGRTSARQV